MFVFSNDETAGTEDDAKSVLCDNGSDGLLGRAEAPEASGGEAMAGCDMCEMFEMLKIKVEVDVAMVILELF